MKHLILSLLLILLCGCWRYSDGTTIGYITTVEGGIFWDTVWIRAELESSQTNGYAIRKSEKILKAELLDTALKRQRIELGFVKHIFMLRGVGDDVLNDEIISYKVIE